MVTRGVNDGGGVDRPRSCGLDGSDGCVVSKPAPNRLLVTGVVVPEGTEDLRRRGWRVCEADLRRRFVVPRAFVDPDRAEHTIATLC